MNYSYKGFTVFIRPSEFLKYGEQGWRPDKATPKSWGYRIDQIPGKCGISRGDGYESQEAAQVSAKERIDSWN